MLFLGFVWKVMFTKNTIKEKSTKTKKIHYNANYNILLYKMQQFYNYKIFQFFESFFLLTGDGIDNFLLYFRIQRHTNTIRIDNAIEVVGF